MKIIKSLLTKNPCYTAGKKITVKGLMLHGVGCPQPKASVFVKNWNKESYDKACVHAFIDGATGDIYQTLPWNYRGWHSGGSANNTHIGVEMCEPASIKYTGGSTFECSDYEDAKYVAKKTYNAAVELFASLCKEFNLDPLKDGVIISHREGYKLGVASNHGDPEHLWKGLGLSYTMDTFRKAVKAAMVDEFKSYTVQVDKIAKGDVLNVRNTPSTKSKVVEALKYNDPKKYTVVEEKTVGTQKWGKLKECNGWVNLYYTKKVVATKTLKVGSTVKVKKGAKTFQGGSLASFVYENTYKVKQINVDRVVIEKNGVVIAAVKKSDLTVV